MPERFYDGILQQLDYFPTPRSSLPVFWFQIRSICVHDRTRHRERQTEWPCAVQKYHHLYKSNTATSHYLLSKVFRAKERIDQEFPDDSVEWKIMNGDSTEAAQKAAKEAAAVKAEKARGAKEAAPGGTAGAPGPGGDSSQSKSDTLS